MLCDGTGLLPLLCRRAGASSVTVVARSPSLRRLCEQVVAANAPPDTSSPAAAEIRFYSGPPASAAAPDNGAAAAADAVPQQQHDLLVAGTLFLDPTGLGHRALSRVSQLAAQGALAPGCAFIPSRLRIRGALAALRTGLVAGLDLSPLNCFRWHPGAAALDLPREPHAWRSAAFALHDVDLADLADSADRPAADVAREAELEVAATSAGPFNAVVVFCEADLAPGLSVTSLSPAHRPPQGAGGAAALPAAAGAGARPSGAASCGEAVVATSWRQGALYVDEEAVAPGQRVALRVSLVRGQCRISIARQRPAAPPRPRHALLASWHHDMLGDEQRNSSYQAAITRAVARLRARGVSEASSAAGPACPP